MDLNYLIYTDENISFKLKPGDFVTFLGEKNKTIVDNLLFPKDSTNITINNNQITNKNLDELRNNVGFATLEQLNVFVAETVRDELAFNLESKAYNINEMKSEIKKMSEVFALNKYLEKSPSTLDMSTKALLSIARVLISKPRVLVIDNILEYLDRDDMEVIKAILNEYNKEGIVLNFTTNIEETLLGKNIIVTDKNKILIEGETLSVLNEEKIMKRLGYGLPFIVALNKYLKDYDLINKYYLNYEELGGAIWK